MNELQITFACPQCDETVRRTVSPSTSSLVCPHCDGQTKLPEHAFQQDHHDRDEPQQPSDQLDRLAQLDRCLVCPSTELFVRKDFPQGLGAGIVCAGLAISCIPWYFHYWFATFAILFATALADLVLYLVVGNVLQCYRCQSQYRGVAGLESHHPFELETHEKHRQQAARQPTAHETK